MVIMLKNKYLFLLVTVFCWMIIINGALASSLDVIGEDQEIILTPGGAKHFSLTVVNKTNKLLEIETKIHSFKTEEQGNVVLFENKDNPLERGWLKLLGDARLLKLLPKEKKKLVFLVSVPPDAENGGYYVAIHFEEKELKKSKKEEKIKSKNILVLLGVVSENDNNLSKKGTIEELRHPDFIFYGPIKFRVKFRNLGKIHYKPLGQIEIYNIFNQKSGTIFLENKNVFPQSSLFIDSVWNRKYFLGKYFVVVKMFDGEGNPLIKTGVFWAFPWKEIGVVIIVIILLIIAKRLRIKKLKFE